MSTPFPPEPLIHRWGTPGKTPLLMLHANSYSAELYQAFLEPLFSGYDILAPDLPGHGRSRWNGKIHAWQDLADYYIHHFDQHPPAHPLVGIGHSIGAVILMLMAIQRPALFEKLILLDPVMLPKGILWLMRGLRLCSQTHRIPLAVAAARRRTRFSDRQTALAHFSSKTVFAAWEPHFLNAYVETCMVPAENGEVELACAPELESSIYQSLPLRAWSLPPRLQQPMLFIIGDHSDTVNHRGVLRLRRMLGNHVVKQVSGGHLFPFEKPQEAMALIKEFLA